MKFQRTADGKRVYPRDFKRQILAELEAGLSAAELGRRHQIPVQNILKWKSKTQAAGEASYAKPASAESVPISEYKWAMEEIKNLKRSLATMTVDRDILKDAVDVATKKKWL